MRQSEVMIEAPAREDAAALRPHGYTGQADGPEPVDMWPGFPNPNPINNGVYDRPRDDRFETKPDWLEIVDIFKQEEAEAPKIYDWQDEVSFLREPTQEVDRTSLLERTRVMMGKADELLDETTIDALSLAQTAAHRIRSAGSRTGKFFGHKERGRFRKSVVTGVVVGALALTGAASLEQDGDSGAVLHKGAEIGLASGAKTPHTHDRTHEPVRTRARLAAVTTLRDGENPWTVSQDQLQAHGIANPTVTRTTSYDKRLLRMNRISLTKAKHLVAGMRLLLPKVR